MKIVPKLVAAAALAVTASTASAAIFDNGDFTTDTTLGLQYLDLGLFGSSTYEEFADGVTYNGREWRLPTAVEMASTWSDVTGLSVTTADIYSIEFYMGFAAADALLTLFNSVPSPNTGWQFMDTGDILVHTEGFNDSHFRPNTIGTQGAWLVSPVPIPATLPFLMTGLGIFGLMRRSRH